MSQNTTLILLPQTTYSANTPYTVVGDPQPAAAYYLGNKDLQTVTIQTNVFTGNVLIQASLANQPSDTDWFNVYTLPANTQAPSGTPEQNNSNTSMYTNIEGNFVFMRAKITGFASGQVNYVKLSY
jgi:hypothetical protein